MKKIIICFVLFILFALVGCNPATKIEEIKNDPGNFLNQDCVVSGIVTEILDVPALNNDAFKIDDLSGVIWVYTTKGVLPTKNMAVKVTGTFKKLLKIPIVNFEAEYYIELKEIDI